MKSRQSIFRILPVITLMALMLMSYNHCLHPEPKAKKKAATIETNLNNSSAPPATSPAPSGGVFQERTVSLEAFSQTVYPITTQRCAVCHSALQQPLHASTSLETAHDQLRDGQLVNFNNINNSRMVLKLRQELHNCWGGNCETSAQQMAQAIENWGEIIDEARTAFESTNNTSTTTPMETQLRTSESMSFNQTMNNQSMYGNGTMAVNLQSASLRAPMILGNNNGTPAITTPVSTPIANNSNSTTAGVAYFNFNVMEADVYTMWGRVNAPTTNSDSFFVRVNNGVTYYEWHTGVTEGFQWVKLSHSTNRLDVPVFLPAGVNVLELKQREGGAQIAEIIFTNDEAFNPVMDDFKPQISLSYDLAPLLNGMQARFEIDVEDYNAYAYKFSNPRITFSNGTLRVKTLNILMNGQMNPQNSTYTLVDRTITPMDNLLSNRSMIVLKEYGNEQDVFAFEFEILEP